MPIRPENLDRYPKHWPYIRSQILVRAFDRCEGSPDFPRCRAENGQPHPDTGGRVVLTVAHLDHVPEHCDGMQPGDLYLAISRSNLRAWCQRCHLHYDARHHAQTRYINSRAGKSFGDLFDEVFHAR